MHTLHQVTSTIAALAAAYAKGRPVRFWLNTANQVVGCWQAKNGTTIAVGQCYARNYKPCAYRACTPADNWANGSGRPATASAMRWEVLQTQAQAQFVHAVREHWCSGEAEFYGLLFHPFWWVIEGMENEDPAQADLLEACNAAQELATARGY